MKVYLLFPLVPCFFNVCTVNFVVLEQSNLLAILSRFGCCSFSIVLVCYRSFRYKVYCIDSLILGCFK